MKNLIKLLTVLFVCVFFNNSVEAQVSFDLDKGVDFKEYKTYSFAGWQEDSDKLLNDIDKKRIIQSFKSEFTIRDMDYLLGNADVIISLYLIVDGGYKKKATLAVEVSDVSADKLVWRGVSKKKIKDASVRGTRIPKIVSKIMKNYPIPPSKK